MEQDAIDHQTDIDHQTHLITLINQLRATLGTMEVALGAISDAIVWLGQDGRVQWCNSAFDKLVDRSHILVLNQPLCELLPLIHSGQPVTEENYPNNQVLRTECGTTEYEFRQGQRSLILEISANHVELADGSRSAVLVIRDTTEKKRDEHDRKQAEEALRRSESRYRALVTATAQGVFTTNATGEVVEDIPIWRALTGMSEAEARGFGWVETIHPDDREPTLKAWRETVQTGKVYEIEQRVRVASGEYRLFLVRAVPILENGSTIREWVGTMIDITEQKQAEEALRLSELKYRHIFENSQVGIGRTRFKDGLYLDVNQRCAEIIGFESATDLIGKRSAAEFYANPGNRNRVKALLQEYGEVRDFEEELRRSDGSSACVLISLRLNQEEDCLDFVMTDISDRKRLEEELRQSQQFLDNIIDNIPLAVFVKDVRDDFRYVLINKGSAGILGFTKEDALGLTDYDLIPQADAELYHAEDMATLAQGTVLKYTEQWKQIHPDSNDTIALRYWKLPLCDPQGNPTHLLCISEDITDRKRAEAAVRQRAEMDSLLSNISRQFIDQDVDTAINFALQQLGEFTRSDRAYVFQFHSNQEKLDNTHEWCAGGIQPFINEAQNCPVDSWSSQILLHGGVLEIHDVANLPPEAAADQAEWQQQSIQSLLVVPLIHAGEVIGCVGLDAVRLQRVWSPETLRLLKLVGELIAIGRARHQAEEKFTKAFRASPSPIAITTLTEGRFIEVNRSYLNLCGCMAEELIGRTADELDVGITQERYEEIVHQFLETGSVYNQEVEFRTRSGEFKIVLLSIELINLSGVDCILNIINDITERKRLENEFISLVSHELRTPLTSLMGGLYLLGSGQLGTLTERGQSVLSIATTNTERLIRLVNDILDLERMRSGKITLQPVKCNIADLLRQATEAMQAMADQAQVVLVTEPVNEELWVDPDRILQTLTNLLSNAIKFSESGSTIWLRAQTGNGKWRTEPGRTALGAASYLHISVTDQGRGIPPDKLHLIFERFQQIDVSDSRQKGGTGLGLAICRNIIEQHGGEIAVESTLGQGSTFYILLPRGDRQSGIESE